MSKQAFRFSIVIPAYNASKYLEDAIISVINQDYGFTRGIQLVLVNDGSTDETSIICQAYADVFPENIVYISQENLGASAARRTGLERCSGEYISFLDADDKWSSDACSCFDRFFNEHEDVPVCACRHWYFGAKQGKHQLNYKFEVNQIIDLDYAWDYPQLSLSNTFIKRTCLSLDYFDSRLAIGEDFLVINRVLLRCKKYGVLSQPIYWYRKREDEVSAMDTLPHTLSYYTDTIEHCDCQLFADALELYGFIPEFLQYAIMYDLQWRIKNRMAHPLDDRQLILYKETIVSLLAQIDDRIILQQRNMNLNQRLYALGMKWGLSYAELQQQFVCANNDLMCVRPSDREKVHITNLSWQSEIKIDFIKPEGNLVRIEGLLKTVLPQDKVKVWACVANYEDKGKRSLPDEVQMRWISASINPRHELVAHAFFDDNYRVPIGFSVLIPAKDAVRFRISLDGHTQIANLSMGKFSPLSFNRYEYMIIGDKIVTTHRSDKKTLYFQPLNRAFVLKRELLYELHHGLLNSDIRNTMKYRRVGLRYALRGKKHKQVWLISDRTTMAGDNGEALFAFLQKNPIKDVETFFVINKDAEDYTRMKAIGKTIAFGSSKHKKLHMLADKIVSSAGDEFVFNRFAGHRSHVRCFEHYDFVFLQHGVTKDDMHGWLNRYKKNIALFVTAARPEYDSIVSNPAYGYGPEIVKATGFPRHDVLLDRSIQENAQKRILITPTWRSYLAGKTIEETGVREENPQFIFSDFFRFYSALINDDRLIQHAEKLGFTLRFLIHPAFAQEAHKFKSTYCEIIDDYQYAEEFVKASIMVTDYSSVAFDFALLKKPIIYAQFDHEKFYDSHPWDHGYFSYDEDGFGFITKTVEETVEALVSAMNEPIMPKQYQERVDGFFFNPEGSRCQRVAEAIMALNTASV